MFFQIQNEQQQWKFEVFRWHWLLPVCPEKSCYMLKRPSWCFKSSSQPVMFKEESFKWSTTSGLDKVCELASVVCRKKFSLAESFEHINYQSSRNLKKESLFLQIFGRLIIYLVKTFWRLDYLIICCFSLHQLRN